MNAKEKALAIIAELADKNASELTPEMEIVADLNIDSPKQLQLLVELEDQLGVEISQGFEYMCKAQDLCPGYFQQRRKHHQVVV